MLLLLEQCKDAPKCELMQSLMARRSEQDSVKVSKFFLPLPPVMFFYVCCQEYIASCLSDLDHSVACADNLDWMSLFVGRLDQPVPAARAVKVDGVLCTTLQQTKAGIQEQVQWMQFGSFFLFESFVKRNLCWRKI